MCYVFLTRPFLALLYHIDDPTRISSRSLMSKNKSRYIVQALTKQRWLRDDWFSCFYAVQACDGQTDERTE